MGKNKVSFAEEPLSVKYPSDDEKKLSSELVLQKLEELHQLKKLQSFNIEASLAKNKSKILTSM